MVVPTGLGSDSSLETCVGLGMVHVVSPIVDSRQRHIVESGSVFSMRSPIAASFTFGHAGTLIRDGSADGSHAHDPGVSTRGLMVRIRSRGRGALGLRQHARCTRRTIG